MTTATLLFLNLDSILDSLSQTMFETLAVDFGNKLSQTELSTIDISFELKYLGYTFLTCKLIGSNLYICFRSKEILGMKVL